MGTSSKINIFKDTLDSGEALSLSLKLPLAYWGATVGCAFVPTPCSSIPRNEIVNHGGSSRMKFAANEHDLDKLNFIASF